jgi:hypothetical protein
MNLRIFACLNLALGVEKPAFGIAELGSKGKDVQISLSLLDCCRKKAMT